MLNLLKMKAPGDTRPTWRNGVLQVHITRACDLSCTGCTQGSNLGGKPTIMSLDNFEHAVWSLRDYYGVVGIFGGNPVIHPKFKEICEILAKWIPFEQRGLWSNNLLNHGKLCREIFNPAVSNLNVHADKVVYEKMKEEWPECNPIGIEDSRHSPPYVAMSDMTDLSIGDMETMVENCDVNQLWSAMICQFRNELRGFFCELAGAQSMLHEHEKDYPDTGLKITDGWWKKPITDFECGVPLRGIGDLAVGGKTEYVSKTHANVYKLKKAGREIVLVTNTKQLGGHVVRSTDYIKNGQEKMPEQAKVLIGVPTDYMARRADFYDYLDELLKPELTGRCRPHGQSPAMNRNLIIQAALDGGFTHVLFLDDDLAFKNDLLMRLLNDNKDIACGFYLMRSYPHQPIAFSYTDKQGRCGYFFPEPEQRGLVKVQNTGLGAALIRTQVFKDMIPYCNKSPHGYYDWVRLGQLETDNWCDDIDFWQRAQKVGYEIYLDLDVVLGHMAHVTVWPNYDEVNKKHMVTYESMGKASVSFPQSLPVVYEKVTA